MAKDGSSSSSSSSSSSGSDSGSSTSGSSSSSSSQGGSPSQKPAPPARPAKSSERESREAVRRARSPSRSPRALKRKRDSPVRGSRYRDNSPPRRRRSPAPRERHDRGTDDRRRSSRNEEPRQSRRDDDRRRRGSPDVRRAGGDDRRRQGSPDGRRAGGDEQRRSGHAEHQNGGRELPPPPPLPADRQGRGGRDRRSGFGEGPPEEERQGLSHAEGPPANGGTAPVEGKIHRSRANRWEPQDDQPLPGPPGPPPQREDRDWNHQSKEEAFPQEDKPPPEANFALSGKLAEESNTVNGVVLLHTEPPEARRPIVRWRLYTFKNGDMFGEPLPIHKQTCYFFGRERRVADIPTDHPSCSKQHAILQYRLTDKEEDGIVKSAVRPYIMDLGSTNGTHLNNERLEAHRYYELLPKDLIKFGNSSREYVLLHERAAEEG